MVGAGRPFTREPGSFRSMALPFAVITTAVYAADQAAKFLIVTNLRHYESIPESGIVRLTHVTNTGSAFGLLQGQTTFLILVSVIGVLGVLFYYRANGRESALLRCSLALLLGGALGNLTDRLIRGAVVDFISVQLWSDFYFPTFNISDSSLTVGLFVLSLYVIRHRAQEKRQWKDPTEQVPPEASPDAISGIVQSESASTPTPETQARHQDPESERRGNPASESTEDNRESDDPHEPQ